ncbi:MAG: putative sugar nucleotidyl transferase [Bacteroidia bacterium]|nr:putative sugar nucleotidyl transferase [Bacteroidia bacterium]
MQVGLFEDIGWKGLLPLTRLRPVWHLWWGMDRLANKWKRYFGWEVKGLLTHRSYLHKVFPPIIPTGETIWINARLLPLHDSLKNWLEDLAPETLYLTDEGVPIAVRTRQVLVPNEALENLSLSIASPPPEIPLTWLQAVTDLFSLTSRVIEADWKHLQGSSGPLPSALSVRGKDNIFFHPSARAGAAILSAEDGPLWIGPEADIQDGAIVQHTNIIGPHTTIQLGARIRTQNSFGPYCKVGGEIGQTTFLGFSNKSHEGFFGHSVIGEWCNIGAGSNTSNLKNTYGLVRLYDPALGILRETGLQFCGLIMGDYARCGIQTPFTTGCVVDIFANVVGTSFTPKYVPPFWWGEGQYWQLTKAIEAAQRMQKRRGKELSAEEAELIRTQYEALVPPPSCP